MLETLIGHATPTEWTVIGMAFLAGTALGALLTGGAVVGSRIVGRR